MWLAPVEPRVDELGPRAQVLLDRLVRLFAVVAGSIDGGRREPAAVNRSVSER